MTSQHREQAPISLLMFQGFYSVFYEEGKQRVLRFAISFSLQSLFFTVLVHITVEILHVYILLSCVCLGTIAPTMVGTDGLQQRPLT